MTLILGVFTILVGFFVFAIGAYMLFTTLRIVANAARAKGTVTSVGSETTTHEDSDGRTRTTTNHWMTVRFYATRDEVAYTFRAGNSATHARVGDNVRVVYNRSKPSQAKVDSYTSLWGTGTILPFVGILFMWLGMFIISR